MSFIILLLLPLIGAGAARGLCRRWGRVAGLWLALVPAVLLGGLLVSPPAALATGGWQWAANLGFGATMLMTPIRWYMAAVVCGIGIAVSIYAAAYFAEDDKRGRLLTLLFCFMPAMLGIVVADNLILLVLFWEVTSVLSFLMIGFYGSDPKARKSAVDALLVTGAGGLALVTAVIFLGRVGGSYQLSELTALASVIRDDPRYEVIVLLVLTAVMTKSAQMPLHFWLPGAMTAPAPVSAYLHSATMVKAGVFLLLALEPILGGTPLWRGSLQLIGCFSMVAAAIVALLQTDLKRLLAYSTVSGLGTLIMLIGVGTTAAAKAALVFLLVHALYKAALFMVAGALEKASGTRDVRQLGDLWRPYPLLAVAAAAAALSMSGVPPFLGFAAKELVYEAKLGDWTRQPLLWAAFVANAATVAVAVKVGILPFFRRRRTTEAMTSKPLPAGMIAAPLALGATGLAFGLFPHATLGAILNQALPELIPSSEPVKLKLWHGFNLVLLLSLATLTLGVWTFRRRQRLWDARSNLPEVVRRGAQTIFRDGIKRVLELALAVTARVHSGRLSTYVGVLLTMALLLVGIAWLATGALPTVGSRQTVMLLPALATVLIAAAAIAATVAGSRLAAVLFLGCAGYGLSLLYGTLGAPDVAITQLLVETLTLLLVAGLLRKLPSLPRPQVKVAKLLLAVAVGAMATLLTLQATGIGQRGHASVGTVMGELSVPAALGRNVVNVILVDFRAFDTLGEVTVLVLALIGIAGMVEMRRRPDRDVPRLWRAGAAVLGPALAVAAVIALLRGHNEPGGGFIGGLMLAVAVWLSGSGRKPWQRLRRPELGTGMAAFGTLICVVSALPAFLVGQPLMTAQWWGALSLPIVGKVALGTPFLFDVGVFVAVAGVTLTIFAAVVSSAREPALTASEN